ncbi:MAG: pyridoxamine 5'-phosphate oxidase family protein [Candidatus Moraniibacteriota bacterium]|nr:MAG: pyridoxamine 5'-phosphate oxidase family protein [Candidatus Moranbacteria bacterium]
MDIENTIREYISDVLHMSLATCKDSKPWVCEVHFSFDNDLNFYFLSKPERRHSQEISFNPHVSGNIIHEHAIGESVRGVYFEGRAEFIPNISEEHPAYRTYCQRFNMGPEILDHGFYAIKVTDLYLFDNKETEPGQKYHLPWSQ